MMEDNGREEEVRAEEAAARRAFRAALSAAVEATQLARTSYENDQRLGSNESELAFETAIRDADNAWFEVSLAAHRAVGVLERLGVHRNEKDEEKLRFYMDQRDVAMLRSARMRSSQRAKGNLVCMETRAHRS